MVFVFEAESERRCARCSRTCRSGGGHAPHQADAIPGRDARLRGDLGDMAVGGGGVSRGSTNSEQAGFLYPRLTYFLELLKRKSQNQPSETLGNLSHGPTASPSNGS